MKETTKKLNISSDPKNLAKARKFIEILANQFGFNEEHVFDIKVATGEAVSNAIEHGSPQGMVNEIKITVEFEESAMHVQVKDEGTFKKAVKVDSEDPMRRGRGIPFMLALMDKVTINETKKGTIVNLVKKLSKEDQS